MSYQTAKRLLDSVFSMWIRKRDGDICFFCGERKATDCFHFIPRGKLATRWEPDNCVASCSRCNSAEQQSRKDPMWREYHIEAVGEARVKELEALSRTMVKYSEAELRDKIAYYRERI